MLWGVLKERNLTPFGLAEQMYPLKARLWALEVVEGVVNAQIPVTDDLAAEFERVLGISAGYWLAAEALYQADLVRLGRGIRVCARCRRELAHEDGQDEYFEVPSVDRAAGLRLTDRFYECGGQPHDVIIRDRGLY